VKPLTRDELEAGLDTIRQAPKDEGVLALIARRPRVGAREVLDAAELNAAEGVAGDSWHRRRNPGTPDQSPDPDTQINVMGARAIALIAQDPARWALAGDQLFLDMDLAEENLPAGTRLQIGSAVIEVTAEPHTGCGTFVERFGADAMKFVNSPVGRALRLRGLNARVVQPGVVRVGDRARKLPAGP
jgi:MOSC domain-containing protein YiiM